MVTHAVLRDETNETGNHRQSRTLTTVDPVTAAAHNVDVDTGYALGPRSTLDPAPLWCVVVRTLMKLGLAHLAPVVSVSSKETDMVGQCL